MKANELMIGSIVRVKGDCEHKPFTVGGIKKDYETWFVYLNEAETWYELRYIEPHPLYPEILDANGFKPTEANDERLFHQDGLEIWIDTKGARHWINIKVAGHECKELPLHYYEGECRYVHELQHIMRLCGIEKEIVLNPET